MLNSIEQSTVMSQGKIEDCVTWSVEDLGESFDEKVPALTDFASSEQKTDYSRWRLLDEAGRQTWVYLATDDEVKKWPQSIADKFHLGLPTVRTLVLRAITLLNVPSRASRSCPPRPRH